MNLMNFVEWSDTMKVLERSSQSSWGETIKQTIRTEQEINKPPQREYGTVFQERKSRLHNRQKKKI